MKEQRAGADAAPYLVGVDMGGTSIKLGRVPRGGHSLEGYTTRATGAARPRDAVLDDLTEAIGAIAGASTERALGIGVGIPATLSADGRIEVLPNFAPGWRGLPIAEELRRRTGLPVVVVNDARAFTLAEARAGSGAGARFVFGLTLGTGVGGGLAFDGVLHLGATGNAGEFGHHVFDHDGPRCGCGSHGCIETYASAPAMVASVMRPFVQGMAPKLVALAQGRLDALTPSLVARAAEEGDPFCREAIERVARVLGVGLANVTTLVGVDRVVVGGGMAGLGEALFAPLRRTLAAYAPVAGTSLPQLVPASLGDGAGALGAALHAADVLERRAPARTQISDLD